MCVCVRARARLHQRGKYDEINLSLDLTVGSRTEGNEIRG